MTSPQRGSATPGRGTALAIAADAGIAARDALHRLTVKKPKWQWTDFMMMISFATRSGERPARTSTAQDAESAARRCEEFAVALLTLVDLVDSPELREVTTPAPGWKDRVWRDHDHRAVAAEVRNAVATVLQLTSMHRLGRLE